MRTVTNYYLFNLSVSDLLLLVIGLPQETYDTWHMYPYPLGETFCRLRYLAWETSCYVSILTITAFTVERYMAICHPIRCPTKVCAYSTTAYDAPPMYVYHLPPDRLSHPCMCIIYHPIRCPTKVCVSSTTPYAVPPRYVYYLPHHTVSHQGMCIIYHPIRCPTNVCVSSTTPYAVPPRYVYQLPPHTLSYQGMCIIYHPIRCPTNVCDPSTTP